MEMPKPTAEHQWLQQLVGDWDFEHDCAGAPGCEPAKVTGIERVRMVGDYWAVCEMEGGMPGMESFRSILTIGFDTASGNFVGSWVGSMMTKLYVYEGELDADRRILTMNTRGPSFNDPDIEADFQDIIELNEDGSRIFRSQFKNDDGSWTEFMRGLYHRKG